MHEYPKELSAQNNHTPKYQVVKELKLPEEFSQNPEVLDYTPCKKIYGQISDAPDVGCRIYLVGSPLYL